MAEKVWVVIDFDREMDFAGVSVFKEEPKWEADFYEKRFHLEVNDDQ